MSEEAAVVRETAAMNILIVDDEPTIRETCAEVAVQTGMRALAVATAEEAVEVLEHTAIDILLTDLMLPRSSGLDLLKRVHDTHPTVPVIVLTQYGTIDSAVTATRLGAVDYVTKPFRIEELRTRLERAAKAVELQQENQLLREQLRTRPGFGGLIGVSERMQRVYKVIQKVSLHEYPVLILGESGTGKELVARSVHFSGARQDRPFIPVDCSSLVPTLIESELFGYVKGAFTGALHGKQGLLEAAHGGTLFLDEIGDMPIDLQAKLLRVLQEREVKPVGSTERRRIDVRVIAATNRDLETAIRNGTFRQDLYFRLNVVQIKLPSLRERKSDIPLLVTAFLDKFSDAQRQARTISEDAMRRLIAYDWPGNVRELENAIERAVALGSGPIVHVGDLPSNLHYPTTERAPEKDELLPLEELERRAILRSHPGHRQDHSVPQAQAVPYGASTAIDHQFRCLFSCAMGIAHFGTLVPSSLDMGCGSRRFPSFAIPKHFAFKQILWPVNCAYSLGSNEPQPFYGEAMKGWRRQQSESTPVAGVARAVRAGASRRDVLQEAAAFLLTHSEADRVGVWTESKEPPPNDETFRGLVVNRNGEETPAEWQRLSPEAPLPAALLTAGKTIEQDLDGAPGEPILGALVDIRHALWAPVESKGRLRGVLMAGVRKRAGTLPRAMLELIAAELALAFELEEQRHCAVVHQHDLLLTKKWLATLAKFGPTDSVLTSLVENCTARSVEDGELGAVFAVLRACEDPHIANTVRNRGDSAALLRDSSESLQDAVNNTSTLRCWSSGDETCVRALEREPLDDVCRGTRETQSPVASEPGSRWLSSDAVRTVAIRLEADGQRLGTLAAGFPQRTFSPLTLERLEVRAALASTALLLRRRNADLAQQAAQQQTLLQASMGATLLVDANGAIFALSRGARQLLPEVVPVDKTAANREPGIAAIRFPELFRARDQQRVQRWLQQSTESRTANALDQQPIEAEVDSGARVHLRWSAAPAGGLAGISLEPVATDNARADRAEARLINVMEWLEEGVVLFDCDHRIRSMNTRFAQIAGLSPEEISRIHTLNALIARLAGQTAQPEQFAGRWREQARGDAGAREEIQLLRPVPRVLERAARPITDASGQRLGRVEIYRDLTGQRVFQSKLLQTEKLAALGQMVTAVAHELSNPLTSILGYAQRLFLRSGPDGEEKEVRQIFEEAERASAILRQLLMTARDSRPERRRVSLNEVVSRTLVLQRFNLEAEKVRIRQDLDPALPHVLGDAGQLQQVLMNLIGNSRQAIEQGGRGGTIRISTAHIGGTRALLEVADNGPGIPEGILARIFDPFFTTKPAGIGTGLGLAIVLGIVREHGGQVRVSSPAAGGAIFSLEFPAARAEEPHIQAVPATGPGRRPELSPRPTPKAPALQTSAAPACFGHLGRVRVLVVEDEPTVARLIADVLHDEGIQVDVLLDGRAAVERVAGKDYDLVICDMKMPGLDGQAFYQHLVSTGNPLQNKFLFVTGDAIAAQTHEFLERNDVPYVAKPFRVEELTEKVHRVLGEAASQEPLPVQESKTNAARK